MKGQPYDAKEKHQGKGDKVGEQRGRGKAKERLALTLPEPYRDDRRRPSCPWFHPRMRGGEGREGEET